MPPKTRSLGPTTFGPYSEEVMKSRIIERKEKSKADKIRVTRLTLDGFTTNTLSVFIGDDELKLKDPNDFGQSVADMLDMLKELEYEVYDEQFIQTALVEFGKGQVPPRKQTFYLALPGKGPYDKRKAPPTQTKESAAAAAAVASKTSAEAEEKMPWELTPLSDRSVAILFPGQGTQKVGMASKLLQDPICKAIFERGSKVLGYDLIELCEKGPQSKLDSTLYSQPSIFVTSYAAVEKLKNEDPSTIAKVKAAAGFSLGEYTALAFSGAVSFEDGLALVKARAEAMDKASNEFDGAMASVAGSDDATLQGALDKAMAEVGGGKKGYIANYMFPEGRTCSGDKKVLEKLCELAPAMGVKQCKLLAVSGAFHTPYMQNASEALAAALAKAKVKMPTIEVYSNVTAQPYANVDEIKELLKRQMLEPVKWEQGTKHLIQLGCSQYIEAPPGRQLKAMMRRINQGAWSTTTNLE
eukprot:CAMPEP_0119322642 /NCGR_PEP_ID=MMETSP1333-20130426/58743_1 /TAXON_ID=418940 /ORGANISM="Scyphosphaera apsteinii, Strain RCC1455" /LENGTH=468 /DNA_ID=CAMNT_0007329919 /DNA_START=30 /DNA_END=1436 /DNA_ORIENTATION=+